MDEYPKKKYNQGQNHVILSFNNMSRLEGHYVKLNIKHINIKHYIHLTYKQNLKELVS